MKLFYGWVIVAVGIVVGCVGMGGMMSFGVFLQPMADSLGWSRTGISTASTLAFLWMGVGGFLWGSLFDRFGARVVVLLGGLLQGLGLVIASQAQSLPVFLAAYGTAVGLAAGAIYVPLTAATASWFTRHRSLAVSLVSAGLALGTTVIAPLARWLIVTHDWRFAMQTLGFIAWAVILPAALLLRPAPTAEAGSAATPSGLGAAIAGMTVQQALKTPVFWSLSLANFACCAAHSGPIFHMVSYAADCGVAPLTAATVLGAAGLAALTGRIICGLLADRTGAKRTLVACLFLQATAIALYPRGPRPQHALRRVDVVRIFLRRRYAPVCDPGTRVFPRKDHGQCLWRRRDDLDNGHGARAASGRLAIRPLRRLRLVVCCFLSDRCCRGADSADRATAQVWRDRRRGGCLIRIVRAATPQPLALASWPPSTVLAAMAAPVLAPMPPGDGHSDG